MHSTMSFGVTCLGARFARLAKNWRKHTPCGDQGVTSTLPACDQSASCLRGLQILSKGFDERDVEDFLRKIPVKLGQGKTSVSLDTVLPNMCVGDIVRACEDFSRNA